MAQMVEAPCMRIYVQNQKKKKEEEEEKKLSNLKTKDFLSDHVVSLD
jgi:hypothetical protein